MTHLGHAPKQRGDTHPREEGRYDAERSAARTAEGRRGVPCGSELPADDGYHLSSTYELSHFLLTRMELLVARDRYRFPAHDANLRYFLRSSA
jgi:hypothetical protein